MAMTAGCYTYLVATVEPLDKYGNHDESVRRIWWPPQGWQMDISSTTGSPDKSVAIVRAIAFLNFKFIYFFFLHNKEDSHLKIWAYVSCFLRNVLYFISLVLLCESISFLYKKKKWKSSHTSSNYHLIDNIPSKLLIEIISLQTTKTLSMYLPMPTKRQKWPYNFFNKTKIPL